MSAVVRVPAEVIPAVREGFYCLMGDACEEIDRTLDHPGRELYPEWFEKERKQLEDVFALLDRIGWAADSESQDVEVDVREHGQTLKEGLDCYTPQLEREAQDAGVVDQRRAERGVAPRKAELVRLVAAVREFAPILEARVVECD